VIGECRKMKKIIALLLALTMCFSLCACGKSEEVKNVEALISAIGEVTLDGESAILAAEEAYNALAEEDKAKVENYADLTAARDSYEVKCVVGEWVDIYSPYKLVLNEDKTFSSEMLGSGTFDVTETGIAISESDLTLEWKEVNGKQRLTCNPGDYPAEFIRAEDIVVNEHEITNDNWQDYFELVNELYLQKTAFGDTEFIVRLVYLKLKDEYVNRLVYTDYDSSYGIAAEISYSSNIWAASIDETSENVSPLFLQFAFGNESRTREISQNEYWYLCHSALYPAPSDNQNEYVDISITVDSWGKGQDSNWSCPIYDDLSLTRIKGSILLYDEPIF